MYENEVLKISLEDQDSSKFTTVLQNTGFFSKLPVYTDQTDSLSGIIKIKPVNDKVLKDLLITIQLIGQAEILTTLYTASPIIFYTDEVHSILCGNCNSETKVPFCFKEFIKKYESYSGSLFNIRYFVRATLLSEGTKIDETEQEIVVHLPQETPQRIPHFEMQIGIPDAIDIVLAFNKTEYCLDEPVLGKIAFTSANLTLLGIELTLHKKESYRIDNKVYTGEEIICREVIKRGHPKKGEIVPMKLSLSNVKLSPTFDDFVTIQYYLKVALINATGPAFFRKVPIILRRVETDVIS